jgi:5-methylcytosine-specific restriction endonuclease McrA
MKKKISTTKRVKKRDKCCVYCGTRGTPDNPLTRDHIYPQAKGGRNKSGNIALSCKSCNQLKGSRTPQEAGMEIKYGGPSHIYVNRIFNLIEKEKEKLNEGSLHR